MNKKPKQFGIFPNKHLNNSLLSYIFLSIILFLRTLFSGLTLVLYETFVLHFFSQKRTFSIFNAKIITLFQDGQT